MTQFLPPNLLALFAPRDPLQFLHPVDKLPHEKKTSGYIGVGAFLNDFEDPKDTPPPVRGETREERIERRKRERDEQIAYKLEQEIAVWDPTGNPNATVDPFKTIFVARINYDTSESKLRREFEVHGAVKKIVMIHNSINGKPRGYAFIEYEHERDMHSALKHADGKKIDGRRVLVDIERARTVKGWLPRRLGGGLGGTRRGGPDDNVKHSGREDNERERERYRLEREREAIPRGADRKRDMDRIDSRERQRSRDRKRRSKSRSRDRKRRRSPEPERRDRERDRGERERKRRRSRSNDRDRRRERRGHDRDRSDRRERKERSSRADRVADEDVKNIRIKEEPFDDYPNYDTTYIAQVKHEEDPDQPEEKYRIPDNQPDN